MVKLLRSEEMQKVHLVINADIAYESVYELGYLDSIEFIDLNAHQNVFQRTYVKEVKRCDELERKIRFLIDEIKKEIPTFELPNDAIWSQAKQQEYEGAEEMSAIFRLDKLEGQLTELENELKQMNANNESISRTYNQSKELLAVLSKVKLFLDGPDQGGDVTNDDTFAHGVDLGFICGILPKEKLPTFERVLWRTTRGNLVMRKEFLDEKIVDPATELAVDKVVFVIYSQGANVQAKIRKICESFAANLYPITENRNERVQLAAKTDNEIRDYEDTIKNTKLRKQKIISQVVDNIPIFIAKVKKEKATYHMLNCFSFLSNDTSKQTLVAEGWCPKNAVEDIHKTLRTVKDRTGSVIPSILDPIYTNEEPPTYFKVGKYTKAFQEIIDAYGIAKYQEINPTVFTIVTFPFLFAVMFGDVGHGFILLIYALLLIYKEKELGRKQLNEMIQITYDGRYVLIIMALFSIFCGFIYNEIFSIGMDIFGTKWQYSPNGVGYLPDPTTTYPFGIDPAWHDTLTELAFYNSFKMKLSVILGIVQMCFGVVISYCNARYFKSKIDVYFQFIPQILFLGGLFGYLVLIIIIKWCIDWSIPVAGRAPDPPSLITLFTGLFLSIGSVEDDLILFSGQAGLQAFLIIMGIICIPWMLLPKPLILRSLNQRYRRLHDEENGDHAAPHSESSGHGHGAHGSEFDFSEVFMHQIIHTIEFLLGSISNTASYLRLWALSLAHSQLSKVFWTLLLINGIQLNVPGLGSIVGFGAWLAATLGVIMVMESLSSFLHALRLHWVEYQNKFYDGSGYKFNPFSFQRILKHD
jgi:V-type H+-transporting ATPase subunit a